MAEDIKCGEAMSSLREPLVPEELTSNPALEGRTSNIYASACTILEDVNVNF